MPSLFRIRSISIWPQFIVLFVRVCVHIEAVNANG